MPKNAHTAGQLHSFPTLVRLCSKSFKPGFGSTWTENFQMYKQGLEKAEEPEIKLPTSAWQRINHRKSKGIPEKHLLLLYWHNKLYITTNWKILKEMRIPNHLTCLLRNLYTGQRATGRTLHGRMDWFQIWKLVHRGCKLSPCLFNC